MQYINFDAIKTKNINKIHEFLTDNVFSCECKARNEDHSFETKTASSRRLNEYQEYIQCDFIYVNGVLNFFVVAKSDKNKFKKTI